MSPRYFCFAAAVLTALANSAWPQSPKSSPQQKQATDAIMTFFERQTHLIAERALAEVKTLEDWKQRRPVVRQQVMEMLGLWPAPPKGDLKATVTGTVEHEDFVVEKLHFQSVPGLYVTANFYRPKQADKPLPTILYLCGHGRVKIEGVSYGNKAYYQHHPAWFVRNGYCSLIIDTLQLGEIEGIHHGTYRHGMWWWHARGYTPAGVEAWNCVRALDYLQTRPEVDMSKIGVTGRSGGGTYTWWLAAIDDRPACLVPVAGIVDMQSHIVTGCIEGHCDCNYYPNIHRLDAPVYAALAAPRPLLLSNSDKDRIFPLDGVVRVHSHLRKMYGLYDAEDRLGLLITEGPHKDTQELRVPCFRWMNRWLRETDEPITQIADKPFTPQQLKVFDELPKDEKNTSIHESFVAKASAPRVPGSPSEWEKLRRKWIDQLKNKSLCGWPESPPQLNVETQEPVTDQGITMRTYRFDSEDGLRLQAYVVCGEAHARPSLMVVDVVDQQGWVDWLAGLPAELRKELGGEEVAADPEAVEANRKMMSANPWAFALVAARGVGPNQWDQSQKKNTQIKRRFFALGRSPDGGRIWDLRRALKVLATQDRFKEARFWMQGKGDSAGVALYAGLFEPRIERFDLHQPTTTHRDGPVLPNVLRLFDMPQTTALVFPRKVIIYDSDPSDWEWTNSVAQLFEKSPLQFRKTKAGNK